MIQTKKPLLALTAADLMTRTMVLLPRDMSLQGAARRLIEADVHGAPVVDDDGRCVGVLSAMDIVHWTNKAKAAPKESSEYFSPWQVVEPGELPGDAVSNYMTTDPVFVSPRTPIGELARNMLDARIHRVIVVEEERRPVGIVSCTDILAAVAHAEHVH